MNCLGKTVAAELAMLRVFRERPDAACVYIGPLKALVRERMRDWRRKFVDGMGMLTLVCVVLFFFLFVTFFV